MMYLDANFFIFSNFDQTSKGENARRIQEKIIAGSKAMTCALTLDEVMRVMIKNKRKEALRETIEDIYATPNLAVHFESKKLLMNYISKVVTRKQGHSSRASN